MSYMHNAQWTPSEKVDLLVNVLQSAFPDLPALLLHVIHEHAVFPKWNDIPLPKGRSLHSSQIAFEEMSRLYRQQGRPPPPQTPIQYPPNPNIAPAVPPQRLFAEPEIHFAQQRALQPRPPRSTDSPVPPVTNGELAPLMRALAPESVPEVRKKRGRPSKEEAEERDRALAAEGKVYQPKKRPTKKFRASTGTPGSDVRSVDAMVADPQTPQPRPAQSKEPGSSGKRMVKRQQEDPFPVAGAGQQDPMVRAESEADSGPAVAQSPSDRLLASHRDRQSRPVTPQPTPQRLSQDDGPEQRQ